MLKELRLQAVIGLLAVIGLAISGYLTYIHFIQLSPICFTDGCEAVQSSRFSEVLGIPVALFGVTGYLLILLSLIIPANRGLLPGVLVSFAGLGYSLYLTYLELFQIHAICQWCVASAVVITIISILTAIRYLRTE